MDMKIMEMLNDHSLEITKLHESFTQMNIVDIADLFENLNRDRLIQIFRLLPKGMASDVFAYITPEKQQFIVEGLTDSEDGNIMNELFVDDAVDFIEEMPAVVVRRVLSSVPDKKRQVINQILHYPEDSAGSIMTTEYVELAANVDVKQAFDFIRATGVNKETIYTCYVTGPDKRLLGAVTADTLLHADWKEKIADIMETHIIYANSTDDRELIAAQFRKYGLLAMPVVDHERQLVGIVTIDDVLNIIEEEDTEDFEIMNALSPSDEPYIKTSVITLAKNRIGWLLFLMLSATFTGAIISSFEDSLAVLPALVGFIPMLMGAGGNAGAQSSTVIIRGMALGEIDMKDTLQVLWREMRVGILCGLGLGLVNFIRIYLLNGRNALLSLVVTVSLCLTLIIAKSMGCLLPILAKRLKMDPAIMAAPLITTIVDCSTLVLYFAIAKMVYHI